MLHDVSATRIQQTIAKLVSFGTRHTLSSQTDPNRGIGAATNWVFDQFQQDAAASDGRMTVEKQSFVQPPGPRNPNPVTVTNVIATLHGSQPESANRIYVVSGHLDSRVTDVLNFTSDAPGAGDDGSGVAAVLELARVMATHKFDATIKFVTFAGEEQGLFGSTFFANQAKQQGMNIAGMFSNDIIGSSLGQNGDRDTRDVRLFAEGPPSNETAQETALRQTMGSENDSPARQLARFVREQAKQAVPEMNVWIIYRRDRFLRSSDHVPFLNNRYPADRFTEPNEDFRHEHQDVRVENGVQFGDLPQFLDYDYIAHVAQINGAALAALTERARGSERSQGRGIDSLDRHPARMATEHRAGSRGLRNRLPRHERSVLAARDTGRQRHELHGQGNHQGQLPLRRSSNRSRRERERRQLPGAEVVDATSAGSLIRCPHYLAGADPRVRPSVASSRR
jgi:Peptidase family M28